MNNSTTNKDGERECAYRGDEGGRGIPQQRKVERVKYREGEIAFQGQQNMKSNHEISRQFQTECGRAI